MSSWFWAVNSKGILALFSGVSRCCYSCKPLRMKECVRRREMLPTTKSESLRAGRETLKARHWALWNWREARGTLLNMKGTSFEAMVVVLRTEARRISKMSTMELIRNPWHPTRWPMRAARNHIYQKRDFTFFLQHAHTLSAANLHATIHIGLSANSIQYHCCDLRVSWRDVSGVKSLRRYYRFQAHAGPHRYFLAPNSGPAVVN
jgi:hypothetical protein